MIVALGDRGVIVSGTELFLVPNATCRTCGRPYLTIMASTAHRKWCPQCRAVLIEAVGEV